MSEFVSGSGRLDASDLTQHAAFLERLARSLVGDVHLAQDLVQETLTVVAAGGLPPAGAGPRAWLTGVLKNRARMLHRSRARRERRERAAAWPSELGERLAGPDEIAARLEMQEALLRAVRALPGAYGDVVVRHFYEGRSIAEIARLTDTSASTLRTRLSRALGLLRAALDRKADGRRAAWCAALLGVPPASVRLADSPGVAGASTVTTLGVLAMSTKKLFAVLAVVVLLAVGSAVVVVVSADDDAPVAPETAERPDAGGTRARAAAVRPEVAAGGDADVPPVGASDPFAALTIDRDRDLHGIVTDPSGAPVAGVSVTCVRHLWGRTGLFHIAGAGDTETVGRDVTGDDGAFALRMRGGTVADLIVRAEGFAEARFPDRSAGERFDVVLRPAAELSVRVVDENDAPVVGASVIAWRFAEGSTAVFDERATTDADGRACFTGLSEGATLVRAESPVLGCPEATRVLLRSGASHDAVVRLVAGRTLVGTVSDADTGAPIAGARVGEGWQQRRAVPTDHAGRFSLRGYAGRSGASEVHATADGYGRALRIPQDGETVDFELQRGDVLLGRVLGADGAPLEGAFLTALAYVRRNDGDGLDTVSGRSAADGSFTLEGLRRDLAHVLIVQSPGHGLLRIPVSPREGEAGVIPLGDIRMQQGLTLAGRVIDASGAAGVPGVHVELERVETAPADLGYGSNEERTTDDLGRFRFADLAAGRYRIEVRRSGARGGTVDATHEVEVATTGDRESVVIELPVLLTLTVTVRDPAGAPIAGAGLVVATREHLTETRTDARGKGILRSPLEIPWTLRVFSPRGRGGERAYMDRILEGVDPTSGALDVVLDEAAIIRGRVLHPDGTPLPRVYVTARRRDGEQVGNEAVSGPSGAFALSVPAGEAYTVEADGRQQLPESWIFIDTLPLRARRGGVRAPSDGIELRLEPVPADRSLTVLVRTPGGRPLPGAAVYVTTRVGAGEQVENAPRRVTDAAGRARFDGLRGQRQQVLVEHTDGTRGEGAIVRPAALFVVPDGQVVEAPFRAGEVLTGRFVGADGQPLAGVHVRLLTRIGLSLDATVTDDQGRFEFVALAGHGHQVSAVLERPGEPRRFRVVQDVRPAPDVEFVLE